MNVVAISDPKHPDWRWRIVNYAGEVVEEGRRSFPTIASAVAEGRTRLETMGIDRSSPAPPYRGTSHLRVRDTGAVGR
jgi:hypothetical protein